MNSSNQTEKILNRLLCLCQSEIARLSGPQASEIRNAKITFEQNRCLHTLFPKSSCSVCSEVCRENAISLKGNVLQFDNGKCTSCGACIRSCSTEAFSFAEYPTITKLLDIKHHLNSEETSTNKSAKIVFHCSGTQHGDNTIGTQIGCFGGIRPSLLLLAHLVLGGSVELRCGDCLNCSQRNKSSSVNSLVEETKNLAKCLSLSDENFINVKIMKLGEEIDSKRRLLFRKVLNELKDNSEIASLRGKAPKSEKVFSMIHREFFLACIELIKEKKEHFEIKERIFSLPGVRPNLCNGCNICALLCPAGCLQSKESENNFKLLADPLRCIGCNRCTEACPTQALVMRKIPGTSEILSGDTRILLTEFHKNCIQDDVSPEARIKEIFDLPIYRT